MKTIPENVSESTRRRNPTLYKLTPFNMQAVNQITNEEQSHPPLRQSSKPKLNNTESDFGIHIRGVFPDAFIVEQDITFRLANGLRYTPDCVVFSPFSSLINCYEVKGSRRKDSRWFTDDSKVKVKIAARIFPFIAWCVAWKENGCWVTQQVKA